MSALHTCAECGAQFTAGRDWSHCQACGYHGPHVCSGVARAVRLERARVFINRVLKKGQVWASLPYNDKDQS